MVTAWSPSVMPRSRPSGRPLRLLWVAALLFGLVYAHGVSPEGVTRHLATIAAGPGVSVGHGGAVMTSSAAAQKASDGAFVTRDHHDGHHGSPYPAHECLVAQPQHGSGVAAPCPALPGRESAVLIAPFEATGRAPMSWAGCPFQDSAVRTVLRI